MSYESIVYRILIASPSDVDEEREVVSRIIQDWNDLNSFNKKIVLLPIKWETHSTPTYGIRPQEAINRQIVDDCDLLIGFFWTKLGTPTGEELGGTIEEIKRVSKAGKPVMLYFSKRGKDPSLIDIGQLQALNKFKEEVYSTALVESFSSIVDFRDKLSRQLEMKIRDLQESKESVKDLITFSFVNYENGKLLNNRLELDVERIEVDQKKELEILRDSRIKNRKGEFKDSLMRYLNRKNNVPVILGVKNNLSRVLNNVNTELRLKSSISDSLAIQTFKTNDESALDTFQLDYYLSSEVKRNMRKIFSENYTQISDKSWEFDLKPFNLLPNKIKIVESLILLYPLKSQELEFKIVVFSDNILKPIEAISSININLIKREITASEVTEVIDKIPEYDDLPF